MLNDIHGIGDVCLVMLNKFFLRRNYLLYVDGKVTDELLVAIRHPIDLFLRDVLFGG